MTLLYPIHLWWLLLLVIPIAVHLFSKKNPTRIKVGTVKLLKQAESQSLRRIKIHEPFLLALRLLIVALLTVLIASPEMTCAHKASKSRWILVDPIVSIEEEESELQKGIDSLVKAGYEVRFLESKFPTELPKKSKTSAVDMWSLLAEADDVNQDTMAFYVVSPCRENSLQGKRPTLSRYLYWIETGTKENTWIEHVSQLSEDTLFVAIGISSAYETRIEHLVVKVPDTAELILPIELLRQGDSIGVWLISKPDEKKWVSLTKTQTWCIVYDDHFVEMLPYLERAVKTIGEFAPIRVSVQVKKQDDYQHQADIQTIWLCKSAPPEQSRLFDARSIATHSPLDENFIYALSKALLPQHISENDIRKVSSKMATPITQFKHNKSSTRKMSLWFSIWTLVTILIALERWITFSRK